MWWLTLLFTAIATPVLAESYTAMFLDPVLEPSSANPTIFNSSPSIAGVRWGIAGSGSRQSALDFVASSNAPSPGPTTPEPVGTFSFLNGEIQTGTGITGITLRITSSSGDVADAKFSIFNTPNTTDPQVSADCIILSSAAGSSCTNIVLSPAMLSSLTNFGLTTDLQAFENNAVAASAGLNATSGSLILAGFGPLLDPTTGFRTGNGIAPLQNTANVPHLIDANGNVFANPDFAVVPEPSTWLLMVTVLPILIWQVRAHGDDKSWQG
jgi:hypothetical protein